MRYGRLDLVPRLSRPFAVGALQVKPDVFGLVAAGADAIETSIQPRGFIGARVELSTMFGRVFQAGKDLKLRHRMRPILRYMLIPTVFGALPDYRLDERDQYGATHQLQAGFETDLFRKVKDQGGQRLLSLAVVQSANLGWPKGAAAAGFSQLGARLTFELQPVTVAVRGSLDHSSGKLTEFGVRATFFDGKYVSIAGDYAHFLNGGYWRMNTGLFELAPGDAIRVDNNVGGLEAISGSIAVYPVTGMTLAYDLSLAVVGHKALFQTMGARIAYTGPWLCGCLGAEVSTTFLPQFFVDPAKNTAGDQLRVDHRRLYVPSTMS